MKTIALRSASTLALLLSLGGTATAQDTQRLQDDLRAVADASSAAVVAVHGVRGASALANPYDAQASPAGFFIDDKGRLITDARFVRNARTLEVRCKGGVRASAKLLGIDPLNGTALLEVTDPARLAERLGGKIPSLPLGSSAGIRIGQSVFTVTNSFGSVSVDGAPAFSWGRVTSIGRAQGLGGGYRGVVIETDASVNPGAFGGPLLDRSGKVVGVLTDTVAPTRWLGGAVPIDQVKLGVEDLLAGRSLTSAFLGVVVKSTGGEAKKDGLEVVRVEADSPAAKAGISAGDHIVALDGARTFESDDIGRGLEGLPPGSPLTVRVQRGGSSRDLRLVLGRNPAGTLALARPTPAPAGPPPVPLNPTPAPRTPTPAPRPDGPARPARASLGLAVTPRPQGGLRVDSVNAGGPAEKAGVAAGDLLLQVGADKVGTLDELRAALDKHAPGTTVVLKVERDGWAADLQVTLGAALAAGPAAPTTPAEPSAERGYLGVFLRAENGVVLVERCEPGSPAERLGLKAGDAILRVNGRPVAAPNEVGEALAAAKPGDAVALRLRWKGTEEVVRVVLGSRPGGTAPAPSPTGGPRLGVMLAVKADRLVVEEVDPKGPCAAIGLRAGDVVLAAEGRPLRTLDDLGGVLSTKKPGDKLALLVERDGWERSFEVVLGGR